MLGKGLSRAKLQHHKNLCTLTKSIVVTDENFNQDVSQASQHSPIIVDFFAKWCGPCMELGPVLEKMCKEKSIKLAKYDIDESGEKADEYGVSSIPAVYVFSKGKIISKFVGNIPEEELNTFITSALNAVNKSTTTNKE